MGGEGGREGRGWEVGGEGGRVGVGGEGGREGEVGRWEEREGGREGGRERMGGGVS